MQDSISPACSKSVAERRRKAQTHLKRDFAISVHDINAFDFIEFQKTSVLVKAELGGQDDVLPVESADSLLLLAKRFRSGASDGFDGSCFRLGVGSVCFSFLGPNSREMVVAGGHGEMRFKSKP